MATSSPSPTLERENLVTRGTGGSSFMSSLREHMMDVLHQEVQPGEKLPSERQLAQRFGVSNVTVGRVLGDLQREGIVNRISGKGTFLCEAVPPAASNGVNGTPPEVGRGSQACYPWILTSFLPEDYYHRAAHRWTLRASAVLERTIQSGGGRTLLTNTQVCEVPPSQRVEEILARGVNAIAIASRRVYQDDPQLKQQLLCLRLARPHLPVVEIHYEETTSPVNAVRYDDDWGCILATRHLLELGHRKLVFLGIGSGLDRYFPWSDRRIAAFRAMVDTVPGARATVVHGNYPLEEGMRRNGEDPQFNLWEPAAESAVEAFFNSSEAKNCTGVVALNDQVATTFLQAARARGVRVPEDFSVTGYDDYAWSATLGLTSIHVPIEEMASRAIEIIQQRLRDPSQDYRMEIVVRPWLLVRESTGAPRQQDN